MNKVLEEFLEKLSEMKDWIDTIPLLGFSVSKLDIFFKNMSNSFQGIVQGVQKYTFSTYSLTHV